MATIIGDVADKLGLDEKTALTVVADFALQLHRHALEYKGGNGDFIGEDLWYQVDRQTFYHLLGFLEYFADRYSWDVGSASEYLLRLGSQEDWEPFNTQVQGWQLPRIHRLDRTTPGHDKQNVTPEEKQATGLRSPKYNLREFSESVKNLDLMQIEDAVSAELQQIKMACHSLGFGYLPKKGSKARQYYDDLIVIISLSATCTPPEFREGYIEEAWPMIHKLSQHLICLSAYKDLQG